MKELGKFSEGSLSLISTDISTVQDLTADLGQLKQHLKTFCQSKTVRDIFEEEERKTRETVATLVKTIEIVITSKRSSTQ